MINEPQYATDKENEELRRSIKPAIEEDPHNRGYREGYLAGYKDAEKLVMERLRELLFGDKK